MKPFLPPAVPRLELGYHQAVAIASSTGGPALLQAIFEQLPADIPVPIFVAQHLPPVFSASFAVTLDRVSPLTVVHAENGMPVYPGTVYLGRGHQHMRIRRGRAGVYVEVSPEPQTLPYKPSGDELFRSCAAVYGPRTLAVIMTGIGRDGTEGARELHRQGAMILTQHQTTCAVYGMPRSAFEAGLSTAALTPEQIRLALLQLSPGYHDLAQVDSTAASLRRTTGSAATAATAAVRAAATTPAKPKPANTLQ